MMAQTCGLFLGINFKARLLRSESYPVNYTQFSARKSLSSLELTQRPKCLRALIRSSVHRPYNT